MFNSSKSNTKFITKLLLTTTLILPLNAYAQDDNSLATDELLQVNTDVQDEVVDEVVVTGTNIRNAVPTFNSVSFTKLDIEKTGVTSVEQFLRRIPQSGARTDPTVGALIGAQGGAPTGRSSGIDLRGLGAQNTLVLVNGRRLATSSNNDALTGVGIFTDISSIPLSAVERIEIVTEGASAVYGADAVGGVINIILLSNFKGGTTKVRYGDSTTGLDDFSAEQSLGFSIGKLSSILSFSYRHEGRGNPDRLQSFSQDDFANFGVSSAISGLFNAGSPGIVRGTAPICDIGNGPEDCFFTDFNGFIGNRLFSFPNAVQVGFPVGLGRAPTLDDVILNAVGNAPVIDPILSQGLDEFTTSGNFDYKLSDKTQLRANGFLSYRESKGTFAAPTINTLLPFDHPSNIFNEDINVSFNFFNEVAAGALEAPSSDSETLTFSGGLGLTHKITDDWQLRLDGTYSQDDNSSTTRQLVVNNAILDEIEFNFDPATAVTPFGPGLFGSQAFLDNLLTDVPLDTKNESIQLTAIVDGPVFKLPAGSVTAAIGLDFRNEKFDFDNEALQDINTGEINTEFCINNSIECDFVFIDQSIERDIFAAFAEVNVPLISEEMAIPLVQELTFTGAGRFDRFNDLEVRSRLSPSAGLRWAVNDNLQFRANYAESFRAPDVLSLTRLTTVDSTGFAGFEDPRFGNQFIFPDTVVTGGNPNLEDETGTSISLGSVFEMGIGPGHFRVNFNYFINNISNQIGSISEAAQLFIFQNSEQFPDFVERDGFGNVTRFNDIAINIADIDVEGYDINASYDFRYGNYDFDLNVAFTNNIRNDEEIIDGLGDVESFIGTDLGPEDYSLITKFDISRGNLFSAGVIGRYHPSYTYNALPISAENDFFADEETFRVGGQLLIDVYATLNLGEFNNRLDGFRLSAGANNLFDPQPNFFGNNPLGLNFGRGAEIRGRVAFIELAKEF